MRVLAGLIGFVYGVVGLASLVYSIILAVTLTFYSPAVDIGRQGLLVMMEYTLPLFNAIVCCLLAYGFFTFRRWGRLAAIAYNACWLVVMGSGLVHRLPSEASGVGMFLLIVLVGFLMGVILFCVTGRGRELMSI